MSQNDIRPLMQWFHAYVAGFYSGVHELDHAVRMKEAHSLRVRNEMIFLTAALKIPAADRLMAEVMALLHDIGRFRQVVQYGTFDDRASINHALLGIRELARNKILKMYAREKGRLVIKAIAYHNVAKLPEDEDRRSLFYMRLLRDADKLDIWKVVLARYLASDAFADGLVDLGLPDTCRCSENVLKSIERHEIVDIREVTTVNDLKLLQMGWVFDLNYIPSLQAVQTRRYVERIAATLPDTPLIRYAKDHVMTYMRTIVNIAERGRVPMLSIPEIKQDMG